MIFFRILSIMNLNSSVSLPINHSRQTTLNGAHEFVLNHDLPDSQDRYGRLCLNIINVDINACWILLIFACTCQLDSNFSILRLCIPLAFLISAILGKHAFMRVIFKNSLQGKLYSDGILCIGILFSRIF